ncbi:hypothetical protein [Daejeonella lutea]|nr:hypothetical protein [Daejeonella lutea]
MPEDLIQNDGRQRAEEGEKKRRQIRLITSCLLAALRQRLRNPSAAPEGIPKKTSFSRTFPEEFPNKWGVFPNNSRSVVLQMHIIPRRTPKQMPEKPRGNPVNHLAVDRICLGLVLNQSSICLGAIINWCAINSELPCEEFKFNLTGLITGKNVTFADQSK